VPKQIDEPYRLSRCELLAKLATGTLYTCARPGRSKEKIVKADVPDEYLHAWVLGLPQDANLIVVSLLGKKPDGKNEWYFYNFHKQGKTFRQWLDEHHPDKGIQVIEHPTTDTVAVPDEVLERVKVDIEKHLLAGLTVVVMDSGGYSRTGQVCRHIGGLRPGL
jgi:hypothetical protein